MDDGNDDGKDDGKDDAKDDAKDDEEDDKDNKNYKDDKDYEEDDGIFRSPGVSSLAIGSPSSITSIPEVGNDELYVKLNPFY